MTAPPILSLVAELRWLMEKAGDITELETGREDDGWIEIHECDLALADAAITALPRLLAAVGAAEKLRELIHLDDLDCSGCTDPSSEGAHQMGTRQHPSWTAEQAQVIKDYDAATGRQNCP